MVPCKVVILNFSVFFEKTAKTTGKKPQTFTTNLFRTKYILVDLKFKLEHGRLSTLNQYVNHIDFYQYVQFVKYL